MVSSSFENILHRFGSIFLFQTIFAASEVYVLTEHEPKPIPAEQLYNRIYNSGLLVKVPCSPWLFFFGPHRFVLYLEISPRVRRKWNILPFFPSVNAWTWEFWASKNEFQKLLLSELTSHSIFPWSSFGQYTMWCVWLLIVVQI